MTLLVAGVEGGAATDETVGEGSRLMTLVGLRLGVDGRVAEDAAREKGQRPCAEAIEAGARNSERARNIEIARIRNTIVPSALDS